MGTTSDKRWTKLTFLDSTVDVRSILIRHYWQVTPVFLACKTVISLQLHMRRGKVLGTRAKKEGWEGEKRKINAPTLLTRLDHCALFPVLPLSVLLHVLLTSTVKSKKVILVQLLSLVFATLLTVTPCTHLWTLSLQQLLLSTYRRLDPPGISIIDER